MVAQADQDIGGWLQSLPDQELQDVRKAANREMRRRGLVTKGGNEERKAARAAKRGGGGDE